MGSKLFSAIAKKIRVKKRFNNCIYETLKFFGPRKQKVKVQEQYNYCNYRPRKKKIRVHEQYNFCIQGTLTFSRETKKNRDFLKVSSLFKNCILRRNRVRICSFVSRFAAIKERRPPWVKHYIALLLLYPQSRSQIQKKEKKKRM